MFFFPLLFPLVGLIIMLIINYNRHGWFIYTRSRFRKLKKSLNNGPVLILPTTSVYGWFLPLFKYHYSILGNKSGTVFISEQAIYISPPTSIFRKPSHTRFRHGVTILHEKSKLNTDLCYRFLRVKEARLNNGILSIFPASDWKFTDPLLEIHNIPPEYETQINALVDYFNN